MPRPEYPSDVERRKTKPAVRVHHSILGHRRTAGLSNDEFAILIRLWLLASIRHAGKTGDKVTLTRGDIVTLAQRTQIAHAERAVRMLAARMEYAVRDVGACVEIHIRNFARKQGFAPRPAEEAPHTPDASESESESESENLLIEQFARAWSKFPKRAGGNPRGPAFEAWRARLREGVSAESLESAVERYAAFCKATGKIGTEHVQQAASFFGPKKRGFEETWEIPRSANGKSEGHPTRPTIADWDAEAARAHASQRNE